MTLSMRSTATRSRLLVRLSGTCAVCCGANLHFRGSFACFDLFLSNAKMRTGAQKGTSSDWDVCASGSKSKTTGFVHALRTHQQQLVVSLWRAVHLRCSLAALSSVWQCCAPSWFGAVISQWPTFTTKRWRLTQDFCCLHVVCTTNVYCSNKKQEQQHFH